MGEEGRAGGRRGEGRWEKRGGQVGREGREVLCVSFSTSLLLRPYNLEHLASETRRLQRYGLLTL